MSRELVYDGILPPLIFEAAFELRWEALKRNLALAVVLSTVGVLLSALVTSVVMVGLVHWPVSVGLLFGILMAATDPVSVLAILKEIGARGRLALLIEAESLLNDGSAAILFAIAIGFVSGQPLTYATIAIMLWTTIAVGLFMGAIVAGATRHAHHRHAPRKPRAALVPPNNTPSFGVACEAHWLSRSC